MRRFLVKRELIDASDTCRIEGADGLLMAALVPNNGVSKDSIVVFGEELSILSLIVRQ